MAQARTPSTRDVGIGFDQAVIGMATATLAGELASVNRAMLTALPDAAPGVSLSELFAAADRSNINGAMVQAGRGEAAPLIVETVAGRETVLVVSPVTVSGDSAPCLLVQILDVNERHRLHQQVAELLETTRDGVVATDDTARITMWNAAAEQLFGLSADNVVGRPLDEFLPIAGPDQQLRHVSGGEVWSELLPVQARRFDGSTFDAEVALAVSRTGSSVGLIGLVRDVTARARLLAELTDRSRRLSNAEQLARVGSFVWDIGDDSISWSEGLFGVFGVEPSDFACTWEAFLERIHPDDRDLMSTTVRKAVENGGRWQLDERILRPDGSERVVATTGETVVDGEGRIVRVQGVCRDVTEQRAAQEALRLSEESFRHGFDDAPIGIALLDPVDGPWRIIRSNQALARLLDLTPDELADRSLTDFTTTTESDLLGSAWAELVDGTRTTVRREVRLRRRGGDVRMVLTSASRMSLDRGSADPLIVHIEDVTARKVAEAELRHRALHDSLTGLPNRALLLDRLERPLEQSGHSGTVVGLLYCGIDDFKLINDTMGHAAGDQLLRTIGGRLRGLARSGDTVARLSGDEFVLVIDALPDVDALMPIVSRAHSVLAQPVRVAGNDVRATASIGLSVGSGIGDVAEDLVRQADMAMHRAKQRGRNTYELFDDTLRRSALQRLEVEQQLRVACAEHQFVVHYQPVVSVHSGGLVGFEALVRWQHPLRGVLAPSEFFSVIEDTDMVRVVGQQVLDAACGQLASWQRQVPDLRMAVNVSGRQLDGTFAEMVETTLSDTGAAASALDLEVTETVLVDMVDTTADELSALDRQGVRLGIDDFGTGYSSLSYLKRLPVRFIKVDRSFVHDMDTSDEDAAIVEAVVGLGSALSLSVTAEGVESSAQLATLDRLGCASAQGYLFSAPCDAPSATALVEGWNHR